jgi:hypothetical protein
MKNEASVWQHLIFLCNKNKMDLTFTTDGVGNCARWRINEGVSNIAVQLPACPVDPNEHPPYSFTFMNHASFPVKLYMLQEGAWRPTNKPMIPPGEEVVDGYVSLTTDGMYQVRNEAAQPVGEFQVTRDNEIVHWPQQSEKQGAVIPKRLQKPLHWPFFLFMILFVIMLVLFLG